MTPHPDYRYIENTRSLDDMPSHLPREIEHFSATDRELENKEVASHGRGDREDAFSVIRGARERFGRRDRALRGEGAFGGSRRTPASGARPRE